MHERGTNPCPIRSSCSRAGTIITTMGICTGWPRDSLLALRRQWRSGPEKKERKNEEGGEKRWGKSQQRVWSTSSTLSEPEKRRRRRRRRRRSGGWKRNGEVAEEKGRGNKKKKKKKGVKKRRSGPYLSMQDRRHQIYAWRQIFQNHWSSTRPPLSLPLSPSPVPRAVRKDDDSFYQAAAQ